MGVFQSVPYNAAPLPLKRIALQLAREEACLFVVMFAVELFVLLFFECLRILLGLLSCKCLTFCLDTKSYLWFELVLFLFPSTTITIWGCRGC